MGLFCHFFISSFKIFLVKVSSIFILSIIPLSIMLACHPVKKAALGPKPFLPNKVIAHRGAFKNTGLPENSIASLQAAIKMGCGGSEFDIHMTSDEVLVVNHDPDFLGLPIETNTYAALQQKKLSNGETIPTLKQYLKTGMQQKYTRLIAEVKTSTISPQRSVQLAEKVVAMVQQLGAQDQVAYIAFSYEVCKKIRQLAPNAPVQYLNGDKSAEQLKADGLDADYHYSVFQKDKNWIANAKKIGIIVNAWTVNSADIMDEFLAQGIDMITTNEPEMLLKKIGR